MIPILLAGLIALAFDARPPDVIVIDTTLVRHADVDGDGQPDVITLRVHGQSLDQPFTRELTIVSRGQVIYRDAGPADQFDNLFKFSDIVPGCSGGPRCKLKWYLEDILKGTVQSTTRLGAGVFDPARPNSIHTVASKHLVEHCKATVSGAEQAIRHAVARVRAGGAVVVVPQRTPVQAGMPLLWFPEYSCFAPIYEE